MNRAVIVLVIGLLAAGCASRPAERTGAQERAVPITWTQPTLGAPPAPDLGSPVTVERGKVVVRPAAAEFRVGDSISVTVANGLDRTIYSDDFKTACSIVILERLTGQRWEPITGCALGRPTMTVAIGSGRGRSIPIDPRSLHLRKVAGTSDLAFGAGTYRIAFVYRFTALPSADEHTVYSPAISIRQ